MGILLRLASAALFLLLSLAFISGGGATLISDSSSTLLTSTVNEVLPEYGLPRGLLPDSVKTYSISPDGSFSIELIAPCYVQFSDLVYYERHIKGKLTYGSISDVTGIMAKKLFLWVPITGIVAKPKEGTVEFQVGFISETLPAKQFEEIPKCKAKAACRGAAGIIQEVVVPVAEV